MKCASAPGKVILFGEHSIVYPSPDFPDTSPHYGIAAAIDRRNKVRARILGEDVVRIKQGGIYEVPRKSAMSLRETFRKVYENKADPQRVSNLKNLGALNGGLAPTKVILAEIMKTYNVSGFEIEIEAGVPRGAHLGSSSSIFAAVAAAALLECGEKIYPQKISSLARLGDTLVVGSPSGIDDTAVSYGGWVRYVKGSPLGGTVNPLKLQKRINVVVGNTGVQSSTGEVVGELKKRVAVSREILEQIDLINSVCDRGEAALATGDLVTLGEAMNENHEILRRLGVSHEKLDEIYRIAIENGAYGAKMTGGGNGGCAIAVAENPQKIVDALVAAGYEAFVTELGCEGVREEKGF